MRADSKFALDAFMGLMLIGCVVASVPAAAQTPPTQEQQRPVQGLRESERAVRAFRASERLRPLQPGEVVTYQDILENPDDVELNYRFAQSQVATGELRGAASTLERILLLSPDLARVRLLYAVVLYRLDNLNEAEREFQTVAKLPMADSLREEVDFYLEQIALRRKTTRYSATLGGGMQWDSNRNAGPSGGEVLFLDTPFDLVDGKKESDFSGVMLAGLRAQHDLGYDAGHTLLGGLQVYGQKQIDVTDLDLMAISGEAGGLYRSPWADVQPGIYATYMNLAGESYLSTLGTGVRANHRFSQSLDVFARVRFDYEWFESLDRSPITDQRTGARVQGGVGATWTPWPMLRFDAGAGGVYKAADQDFYAYSGPLAYLSGTWLLGRGQFLLSTFTFEYDGYEGPEPIISSETRRDAIYLGGITYGAPLGFLLPFLGRSPAFRDTLFTVNATYLNVQSTIENYQYDDLRFTVMYTKNFEF
jgi:tetratricopeptide (TPR) repeat protein